MDTELKQCYKLFGLKPEDANRQILNKRYRVAMKRVHPDLQDIEHKKDYEEVSKRFTNAYSRIMDDLNNRNTQTHTNPNYNYSYAYATPNGSYNKHSDNNNSKYTHSNVNNSNKLEQIIHDSFKKVADVFVNTTKAVYGYFKSYFKNSNTKKRNYKKKAK